MDGRPAADADKYNKLKDKYNQLKEAARKEVQDKNELCARLEKQLKDKEATLRQQLEEIDGLKFQNGRLSKQLGTLTAQVEEQQKQKQQTSWSVQGLISGNQHHEALQKAQDEVGVLRDELMMKINENEELHMNLFEVQRQREEEEQRLHESHAAVRGELEQKASDLEAERTQKSRLLTESQELARQIQYLEDQLSESQTLAGELRRSLHDQRRGAAQEARSLRTQLARWAPFDEAEHPAWSRWDSRPARGREAHRQGQASQHLQASIADACRQGCGVFQAWSRVFGSGCDEEPAARLRVRSRLADVAQQLAVAMEAAPELFAASWHPGPGGALLAGRFRQGADAILRLHRRWATYQSLLLLHDWSGGQAGRSTQEEIQAQAFVDCMWRLCRCVKSLFVKLSLLACMPTLLMRDCSSNHFDLARASLRRPRRLDGERSQPDTELLEVTPGAASSTAAPPMGDPPAERVPGLLLERLRGRARDALQCWEGIGRCLSALATQQAGALDGQGREGRAMLELLESIKRLCSLTAERVLPTADCAAAGVAAPGGLALLGPGASLRAAQAVAGRGYLRRATARLAQAPVGIGFEEALQARRAVRQLMANRRRLADELGQQALRLQVISEEKAALAEELRALQDSHELLRSNFQVMQDAGGRSAPGGSGAPTSATEKPGGAGSLGELVLSSRQRALLDSVSVTAQESASLRQHGFFVDVISLSAGEASLASGPPSSEALESWELAVRKVYEQHVRSLQAQVRSADGKATELHLSMQHNLGLLKEQEEAKQTLRDQVSSKHEQLNGVLEDMATTRKNYDSQLAVLTEHICGLSQKISEKDESLASLQTQKVLCGHCGTWSVMGKLLSPEAAGVCQTCKEKVLSKV